MSNDDERAEAERARREAERAEDESRRHQAELEDARRRAEADAEAARAEGERRRREEEDRAADRQRRAEDESTRNAENASRDAERADEERRREAEREADERRRREEEETATRQREEADRAASESGGGGLGFIRQGFSRKADEEAALESSANHQQMPDGSFYEVPERGDAFEAREQAEAALHHLKEQEAAMEAAARDGNTERVRAIAGDVQGHSKEIANSEHGRDAAQETGDLARIQETARKDADQIAREANEKAEREQVECRVEAKLQEENDARLKAEAATAAAEAAKADQEKAGRAAWRESADSPDGKASEEAQKAKQAAEEAARQAEAERSAAVLRHGEAAREVHADPAAFTVAAQRGQDQQIADAIRREAEERARIEQERVRAEQERQAQEAARQSADRQTAGQTHSQGAQRQ